MDIGALLNSKPQDVSRLSVEHNSHTNVRSTSEPPCDAGSRMPVRLPGLEVLLQHHASFSSTASEPPPPLNTTLAPPAGGEYERRPSLAITSPYSAHSASPSPALSNASTAMTSPPPKTPPPLIMPATGSKSTGSPHSAQSRRNRREHRPTYQIEEEHFIWYHRIDLGMDWQDIRLAYNAQFPSRHARGHQGIQCKYYRCTEHAGVPKCRERNRSAASARLYGLRAKYPQLWYPWMREPRPAGAKTVSQLPLALR